MLGTKRRTDRADKVIRDWWDIHNHILPGVDDGSGSVEESVNMIREEHEQGVRHIIFTPHYRPGMFTVNAEERTESYKSFREIALDLFPDMTFQLGCEVHVHKNILQTLKTPACRMDGGLVVLLEYSTRGTFRDLEHVLLEMMAEGYQPILAHAERYRCLYENLDYVKQIKDIGTHIQINAETFLEKKRSPGRQFADDLMHRGMVDFVASDAHDMHYRRVRIADCARYLGRQYGEAAVSQVFRQNQEKLFL